MGDQDEGRGVSRVNRYRDILSLTGFSFNVTRFISRQGQESSLEKGDNATVHLAIVI